MSVDTGIRIDAHRWQRNRDELDPWLSEHRPGWQDEAIRVIYQAGGETRITRLARHPLTNKYYVENGDPVEETIAWENAPTLPTIRA